MLRPRAGIVAAFAAVAFAATLYGSVETTPQSCPALQRFLSLDDSERVQYRALRHLEARNDKFDRSAWMDVWTEVDRSGAFQFSVASQGGSDYIRDHVMLAALQTEQRMWQQHVPDQAALTPANYVFEDRGAGGDGLVTLAVKPRRKDGLLFEGSIFVRPDDGELVRIEGQLAKPPSFWTRHVDIVRWYQRIAGVRMPVAVESVANVRIAGRSTFRMSYEYETVNGQRVGAPQPRIVGP